MSNLPAIIEAKDLVSFNDDAFSEFLARVRNDYAVKNPDISTEKGREEIKSAAYKVAKLKRDVERQADKLKEDAQKTIKSINDGKKKALEKMQELQDEIRKPVTDMENAEAKRIKQREDWIASITGMAEIPFDAPINLISERIKNLENYADYDWQEFKNRATMSISVTRDALTGALARRQKEIDDAAEIERQRALDAAWLEAYHEAVRENDRIDNEALLEAQRKEAAERAAWDAMYHEAEMENRKIDDMARIERERIANAWLKMYEEASEENRRLDRLAQAEADRLAAIKAGEDAEWLRMYHEADKHNTALDAAEKSRKDEADRIERQRLADEAEQKRRDGDVAHKAGVNRAALAAIIEAGGVTEVAGKAIITAIAQGKIPNVKIIY